ncbi:alginate lyase-domain-containing protein [Phascolomyces articulosus]|uniref:Alginate lyase-domain-containing protein n=1 Tax=Phascolomyces articulosus TaxID=60185 RepID=A0AAD5JSP8_9FUNG|nr:alginate lyase-domain-containing protein [Phascolomyces articulosus]
MGPKKPEIEYIHLRRLAELRQNKNASKGEYQEAYESLRKLAQGSLKKGPFSITTGKCAPHIAASGDPRDFLSYAPYWWPEEKQGKVAYVRRDGKRNPDCSDVKDQSQLEALAENLIYLCLGYYLLGKPEYAAHAITLIDTFFVSNDTRMNPHVNYGQVVRGINNPTGIGRGEGIISTRFLATVANILPLLKDYEGYNTVLHPVHLWFTDYLRWLLESPIGQEEAAMKNNHHTFYIVQVAVIQQFLRPEGQVYCESAKKTIENYYNKMLPTQIDAKTGNQPLEVTRTRPFHYLEFNLHGAIYLAELGLDAGCCNVYQQQKLIPLATTFMVGFCKEDTKENMTEGIRTVEIVKSRYGDTKDQCYAKFLEMARNCKDADTYCGPKQAISRLWFRDENETQLPTPQRECKPSISSKTNNTCNSTNSAGGGEVINENDNNNDSKGNKAKAIFNKVLHRSTR